MRLILVLALTIPIALAAEEKPEPDYDALLGQFTAAEKSGELEKALGLAKQMAEITFPQHIEATYNLARMHALTGDRSRAYEYLYLVRIPAHRDQRFRANVITHSGDHDHGFR